MLKTFADRGTEDIFQGRSTKHAFRTLPAQLHQTAKRKLDILDYADDLDMLRLQPGSHLESLIGDRQGQFSVRINCTYRICFCWIDGQATDVEIVNYH
jgi:proteic killer suppression protein